MDLVDEIDCLFEIFFDGILRNILCIVDIFVIEKGSMEMQIPFAHLRWFLQGVLTVFFKVVLLCQEILDRLIFIDLIENFGNFACLSQHQEQVLFNIGEYVKDESRVDLFYGFPCLKQVLSIQFFMIFVKG